MGNLQQHVLLNQFFCHILETVFPACPLDTPIFPTFVRQRSSWMIFSSCQLSQEGGGGLTTGKSVEPTTFVFVYPTPSRIAHVDATFAAGYFAAGGPVREVENDVLQIIREGEQSAYTSAHQSVKSLMILGAN